MFEVVQHEQELARAQMLQYQLESAASRGRTHIEDARDRRCHQAMIAKRREIDEGDAVGERGGRGRRDGQGEPCFSDAARARQGYEPRAGGGRAEQRADLLNVCRATNQRRQR